MQYTPRTCPGPGDLGWPSPAEEKRQDRYEELELEFFEVYIPSLKNEELEERAEDAGLDDPEISQMFDQYLKDHEWK